MWAQPLCRISSAFLGRQVPDWTASDLERLKAWAKGEPLPVDHDAPPQSHWDTADAVNK
jgi:hypothetical protein